MTHLAEGTLQAYLDDEISGRDRAAAAEHLLVCGECRSELDGLKRANQRLSAALADLDVPTPAGVSPRAVRARARVGSPLLRAAVMVLLVAAAASATVPGSPVREWIAQAVRPADTAPEPVPAAPIEEPVPERPASPAGIAVPGLRDVDVVVSGLQGATIRLVPTDGTGVAVSARGGERDPLFRMAAGRIEVVGGAGGELVVEVPRTRTSMRLVVDGRRYAETVDGELRVIVPADRDGDAVVWR